MKTAVIIFFVCIACLAQNQPAARFTARAELVSVPVVVSQQGKFRTGLSRSDFVVLEDGKAKTIAYFEEISAQPDQLSRSTPNPGEYTNRLAHAEHPSALTIIVIDRLFTGYLEQNNARQELTTFLSKAAERREPTMVAVIGSSGLKIIHNFTTSSEVLVSALKRVRGTIEPLGPNADDLAREKDLSGNNTIASPIDVTAEAKSLAESMTGGPFGSIGHAHRAKQDAEIEKSMLAFEQLALAVRGIPGRKTLLWVSPGFECPFFGDAIKNLNGEFTTPGQQCVNTWRELAAANIAVYQVNPTQTVNPGYADVSFSHAQHPPNNIQRELMNQSLTTYTGGTVCSFRNDLDTCFRRAVEESSQYYLIGYYATPSPKPVWRKIDVKVNVPKAAVRARSGYITAGTEETWEQRRKNDVAVAVVSPLDYTGVPMTVRWTGEQQSGDKRKCSFEIRTPAGGLTIDKTEGNHLKVNVVAVAIDPELQVVGDVTQSIEAHLKAESLQQLENSGFVYKGSIEVPAGDGTVKFVLRDDLSGRMGSVTAQVPSSQAPK